MWEGDGGERGDGDDGCGMGDGGERGDGDDGCGMGDGGERGGRCGLVTGGGDVDVGWVRGVVDVRGMFHYLLIMGIY